MDRTEAAFCLITAGTQQHEGIFSPAHNVEDSVKLHGCHHFQTDSSAILSPIYYYLRGASEKGEMILQHESGVGRLAASFSTFSHFRIISSSDLNSASDGRTDLSRAE